MRAEQNIIAEKCLVATCARLSLVCLRDENFALWCSVIRDVFPDCRSRNAAFLPLKNAAERLVTAPAGRSRDNAFRRLRFETEQYFGLAAAEWFEGWKNTKGGQL